MTLTIVCITLSGEYISHGVRRDPHRRETHFRECGVDAQFFYGINAPALGLRTTLTYEIDAPGSGYIIGPSVVGCWLSHRALWSALLLMPQDVTLVLEDDAKFPPDWRARTEQAMKDAGDFDVLFLGSCCTSDKPKKHIAGSVYEVRWPMCTHGYIVRKRVLEKMIATQDAARCYAPIDISLMFHTFAHLDRVYTVLPRILEQFDTEILP